MTARSSKGSINRPDTEAQDQILQIITFGLQRAAGPYRWAISRHRLRLLTACASGNFHLPLKISARGR
jgi:hypothetical protein